MTIQEAALFLRVSAQTLRRWEAQGLIIPSRTVGNQRRYSQAQLEAFIRPDFSTPYSPFRLSRKQKMVVSGSLLVTFASFVYIVFIMNYTPAHPIPKRLSSGIVLASETIADDYRFSVNVPALFNKDLTAPNVIYGLVAGDNITLSEGQSPTISAVVPDQTTDLKIFGNLKVGSTTITAGSKTDTLELVAGSNISLSTSDKKITIANSYSAPSTGWEKSGDIVQLSATGNLVKINSLTGIITTGIWNGTAITDTYLQNPNTLGTSVDLASEITGLLPLANLTTGSENQILVVSGGVPAWTSNPSGGSSGVFGFLQRNSGVLSSANITDDLAIGGTATASALLQISAPRVGFCQA